VNGERADMIGNWSAALMSVGGGVGPTQKEDEDAVKIFALPELSTDWGSRWISNKSPLFDPVSYNNGTAWPFASGLVAWAQYAHGQPLAGYQTLMSVAHLTGAQAPGAVPEHMSGSRNEPGSRSVPHQLFSSWALIRPLVAGMVGLSATIKDGTVAPSFFPSLPPNWPEVAIRNLRFRNSTMNIEIGQEGERAASHTNLQERIVARRPPVAIVPIDSPSERGETNLSLKVLGVTQDETARIVTLELAGLGGRPYDLDLVTTEPRVTADGAQIDKITNGYRLHIAFGPGDDYVTKTVTVKY
jgi:hypothetical protein